MDFNVDIFSRHVDMGFNVYKIPSRVTRASITIFGGKKMQSNKPERCFSSKGFKCD